MKKYIYNSWLMLFITIATTATINAQGPYFNIRAGYSLSTASGTLPGYYNRTEGNGTTSYEQVNVSLGKGFNFGGDIGTMINEHVGFQLGVDYLLGGKSKARYNDPNGFTDMEIWANMLRITPSIVLATNAGALKPYARFGVVFGKGVIHRTWDELDQNDRTYYRGQYDGGMSVGINSAIGVSTSLNDKASLFCELNMFNMTYSPKTFLYTENTRNGADRMPSMTTEQKQIDYYPDYSTSGNHPDYEPTKALKMNMPFSSIGLNIGIKFPF